MNHFCLLVDSVPLPIRCWHCGETEIDDFEVVEANRLHSMRCAACGTSMHVAVLECLACGAETYFSWPGKPASDALSALFCVACARRYCDEAVGPAPSA